MSFWINAYIRAPRTDGCTFITPTSDGWIPLDERLFARFPHPWLVVDDAHVNYAELMPFVVDNMHAGDYFIAEDALAYPTADIIAAWVRLCDRLKLRVDSKYTDAFGYNVTCAPNAWFKKVVN